MVYVLRSGNKYLERLYDGKIFIVLKGTIYSHKKQHTG